MKVHSLIHSYQFWEPDAHKVVIYCFFCSLSNTQQPCWPWYLLYSLSSTGLSRLHIEQGLFMWPWPARGMAYLPHLFQKHKVMSHSPTSLTLLPGFLLHRNKARNMCLEGADVLFSSFPLFSILRMWGTEAVSSVQFKVKRGDWSP